MLCAERGYPDDGALNYLSEKPDEIFVPETCHYDFQYPGAWPVAEPRHEADPDGMSAICAGHATRLPSLYPTLHTFQIDATTDGHGDYS